MGEWNMAAALDVTNPNDLLYWAWTVLANVSEGNWSEQTPEWQAAVMKWRDAFHGYLDTLDNDGDAS